MKIVGYVPQEIGLIEGTLEENICLGVERMTSRTCIFLIPCSINLPNKRSLVRNEVIPIPLKFSC